MKLRIWKSPIHLEEIKNVKYRNTLEKDNRLWSFMKIGMFVIHPSLKIKNELLDIVRSGSVSDCGGWENAWPGYMQQQ